MCSKTGNVAIEFKCRGKPSGICSTKSDAIVYVIANDIYIIKTQLLQVLILYLNPTAVSGGDKGSDTGMYLLKKNDFIKKCYKI